MASHQIRTDAPSLKCGNRSRKVIDGVKNPGPNDVLCGRGGGINSHRGNKSFRDMVKVDKEEYKVATDKFVKAAISQRIIEHVKSLGGKFLKRQEGLWVEIEHHKALAKTCQALREGPPSSRAKVAKKQKRKLLSGCHKKNHQRKDNHGPHHVSLAQKSRSAREGMPRICGMPHGGRGKVLVPISNEDVKERNTLTSGSSSTIRHSTSEQQLKLMPIRSISESPDRSLQYSARHREIEIRESKGSSNPCSQETPPLLPLSYHMDPEQTMAPRIPQLNIGKGSNEDDEKSGSTSIYKLFNDDAVVKKSALLDFSFTASPESCHIKSPSFIDSAATGELNKPDARCIRMHSLATSDVCSSEGFQGNETFSNPFDDEDVTLENDLLFVDKSNKAENY